MTATPTPPPLRFEARSIDRIARVMRRIAYFWAFVSFVIVCRWIKVDREDIRLFDVAWENNIWTWLNVVYMIAAAMALLLAASVRRHLGLPAVGWLLAGVAVLLLSLDDMISIHERLDVIGEALGGGSGIFHFAWVIPGIGAALICVGVFWSAMRTAAPDVRHTFLLGVAFFFGGALLLEMVGGAVLSSYGHRRPYTIIYHIEEICEAVGIVLIFSAALRDLAQHIGPQLRSALRPV